MRFTGYAAIFDHVDRGGDVVRPGAFAKWLDRGNEVSLLWQHDAARPIGKIERLAEDARGLHVIGHISDTRAGRDAAALVTEGTATGISFGYRVRKASGDSPRELIDVELVEISLVTAPMQPRALILSVDVELSKAA